MENNILNEAIKTVQNVMKHSNECPEYLAQIMDEKLDKIKNLTLGMDEDCKGDAIFYTTNNEDFQRILKVMSFFGDEYTEIKCWNYTQKEVVSLGGVVDVIEWYTKFPFKVYDTVVYKVLKDKEKLIMPVWVNNDPELKDGLHELAKYSYAINPTLNGTKFYMNDESLMEFVQRNCDKDIHNYTAETLPYYITVHTVESILVKFGYYKYSVNEFYKTEYYGNNVWCISTNFPFEYMYNEIK